MLSTDELAAIRAQVEQMLPDTCSILSLTMTVDGQGGYTESWGTASTEACRLDPISGKELQAGAGIQDYHTFRLTLPYDAVLTTANRVQIGAEIYAVTSVDDGKSWDVSTRANVEKV